MKFLIQKGLADDPDLPKNAEKIEDVVIAKSIDVERDEECQVPLSRYNLNYVFQKKDSRDKPLKALFKDTIDVTSLPNKVDLSENDNWGEMFDQGDLGSCVSNSVAYCIRFVRKKEGRTVYDPSRLFIYYFGRLLENMPINEDTGLYIRSGYKSVARYSVCSEKNWAYKPIKFAVKPNDNAIQAAAQHKTFSYLYVDHTLTDLKKCLSDGYPISFGFTVFDSFMSSSVARTGQVPYPKVDAEEQFGGHAVTLVGYDDEKQMFKIANSWGNKWGDNGFCYMPYKFILNDNFVGDFWTARSFS